MTHILANPLVCVPSYDQLHPELVAILPALEQLSESIDTTIGAPTSEQLSWLPKPIQDAVARITVHGPGVFSAPFLHPDYCAELLKEAALMEYKVNPEEEPAVQIPEVALLHVCPQLHSSLATLLQGPGSTLFDVLLHGEPARVVSVQFAQYTPENTAHGNWHTDKDSDLTLVVALSDTHEGGGTEVKLQGFGPVVQVPTLPVGHAMIFRGKSLLHKGMPVTAGVRNILVFWSEIK